jgi:exodeoxyribonuclease VII small subunit
MTDTSTGTPPAGEMGYEQARDELIAVVRRLEAGGSTLEESLALWERGEELAAVCRRWLEGARARLDAVLTEDGDGGEDEGDGALEELEDDGEE